MNIYTILCCLVKSLNCVVYEYILIERVFKKSKKNINCSQCEQSLYLIFDINFILLHKSS